MKIKNKLDKLYKALISQYQKLIIDRNFILAAVIFTVAIAVYLFTLAPSVTMEDSAELITTAYTLGIAHPSGYPLYVLLGHLFTCIPWATIAWRVNLLSAVFGALTIALFYLILVKINIKKPIAFCCGLVAAFGPIFWSQSVVAKFYTLNTFFVCLLILILLIWSQKKENKYLLWFSLLYGVSLTNHTMIILLAPAFAVYIVFTERKIILNWPLILKMFILFLLGLLVYLYIPIRAWQKPVFNWGIISTWHDVWVHIGRRQYNDFSPLLNSYGKVGIFVSFIFEIYRQFFWPALLLAFLGVVYLWQKSKALTLLTVGVFLGNSLGIIFLRKFGWGLGIDYTYRVYYLPAFLMVIVWVAFIINYLYNFLIQALAGKPKLFLRLSQTIFFVLLFSLPPSFLINNYKLCDFSHFWFNYDYTKNLLASLEPNSIYYFAYDGSLQGDTELFTLAYFKMVQNFRPDVSVISEQNLFYKDVLITLPKEYYKLDFENRRKEIFKLLQEIKGRPIYSNFAPTNDDLTAGVFALSNGYAYRFYSNIKLAAQVKPTLYLAAIRGLSEVDELDDYPTAGLAAHYYYNLASFYLTAGQKNKSQYYLIKAFNLDTAPQNHEYRRFMVYRSQWLKQGKN
ncbi:MAG: DUF2723 domain-containing protein [Patescibacteria group bacterium]